MIGQICRAVRDGVITGILGVTLAFALTTVLPPHL